jgi:hypothetical protein
MIADAKFATEPLASLLVLYLRLAPRQSIALKLMNTGTSFAATTILRDSKNDISTAGFQVPLSTPPPDVT